MSELLHELPLRSAQTRPDAPALIHKGRTVSYATLAQDIGHFASALIGLGVGKLERVGIYLPKQPENVVAMFGAPRAGGVFVPVNPLLKAPQVAHILRDCNVRVLITSPERAASLAEVLGECPDLQHLILIGGAAQATPPAHVALHDWDSFLAAGGAQRGHRLIVSDVVSIFYTS